LSMPAAATRTAFDHSDPRMRTAPRIRSADEEVCFGRRRLLRRTRFSGLTPRALDAISSLGKCSPTAGRQHHRAGCPIECDRSDELIVTNRVFTAARNRNGIDPGEKSQARLRRYWKRIAPVVTVSSAPRRKGNCPQEGEKGSRTIRRRPGRGDGCGIKSSFGRTSTSWLTATAARSGARTFRDLVSEGRGLASFARSPASERLNPVVQSSIPVWIRNSFFCPERPCTKITPERAQHVEAASMR